uniref:Uncharacterized protein n=1 Tax=Siphoviridae sp. ctMRT7 TaxID=2827855 RepID=A0A8S5SSW2_9CAUD|nr:MAG TPA: hypothetical protein [Siphoviridae sp. ctMRT7]
MNFGSGKRIALLTSSAHSIKVFTPSRVISACSSSLSSLELILRSSSRIISSFSMLSPHVYYIGAGIRLSRFSGEPRRRWSLGLWPLCFPFPIPFRPYP